MSGLNWLQQKKEENMLWCNEITAFKFLLSKFSRPEVGYFITLTQYSYLS